MTPYDRQVSADTLKTIHLYSLGGVGVIEEEEGGKGCCVVSVLVAEGYEQQGQVGERKSHWRQKKRTREQTRERGKKRNKRVRKKGKEEKEREKLDPKGKSA